MTSVLLCRWWPFLRGRRNVAFLQINMNKCECEESDCFDASRHFTFLDKEK